MSQKENGFKFSQNLRFVEQLFIAHRVSIDQIVQKICVYGHTHRHTYVIIKTEIRFAKIGEKLFTSFTGKSWEK